jgi:hypothetical protein
VPVLLASSVTWRVKLNVPAALGVPVMSPVLLFKLKPVGSDPTVTAKFVYVPDPPKAVIVCVPYDVPFVPFGNDDGLTVIGV